MRTRTGWWLRRLADRIDPGHAPRRPGQLGFTFQRGRGLVTNDAGRGCPLWYLGEADYQRAFDEAEST